MGGSETNSFLVRDATERDVPAITEIYGHYVRTHLATFELEAPDEGQMLERMRSVHRAGMPYFVAEHDASVLGYCYASSYRERAGYRFTVEDSVYVAAEHVGRGIGRALLERLVASCREGGYRELIGVIGDSANDASIRLHTALGFRRVGTLENVGFKFGRWVDVVFVQRSLAQGT